MTGRLSGKRVLVTRAAHQAGKLSTALRAAGAEPVEVPVLEIRPPESFDLLDRSLKKLKEFDWIIFTSANTVRALAGRAATLGIVLGQASQPMVGAVGEATAAAAEEAGFAVSFVPEAYVSESLIACLTKQFAGSGAAGKRILLARAAVARDIIPEALSAAGAEVEVVDAYRNVVPESAPEQLRQALAGGIDAATFTSSSSVTHLAEVAKRGGVAFPFAGVLAISIGPVTSTTLREFGWSPAAEASPSDIAGLVSALSGLFL